MDYTLNSMSITCGLTAVEMTQGKEQGRENSATALLQNDRHSTHVQSQSVGGLHTHIFREQPVILFFQPMLTFSLVNLKLGQQLLPGENSNY